MDNEHRVARGRQAKSVEKDTSSEKDDSRRGLSILEVFDYSRTVDSDGRPLQETGAKSAVIERAKRAGVPFEHEVYRFGDSPSRMQNGQPHRYPYDSSAMEQMLKDDNYKYMLAGITHLRSLITEGNPYRRLTLQELLQMSIMANGITPYIVNRVGSDIRKDAIPPRVAVLHKAMAGMHRNITSMLVERGLMPNAILSAKDFTNFPTEVRASEVLAQQAPVIISPEDFYASAESGGHFIGVSRVCAARPRMVLDVASALIDGPDQRRNNGEFQAYWEQLLSDLSQLQSFSDVAYNYSIINQSFDQEAGGIIRQTLAAEGNKYSGKNSAEIKKAKQQLRALEERNATLEKTFVRHLTALQPDTNKYLGRNNYPKPITQADLYAYRKKSN